LRKTGYDGRTQISFVFLLQAILDEQLEFMKKGKAFLKPMKLKTISNKLQMHPSTVCRTVKNKYVGTPHGVFELKFFFDSGIQTENGEEKSSEHIKAKIKNFIDAEDKRKPLSDQKITDMLNRDGINISRRTVMKYREEMNLLSSRLRGLG
jgi:RNA polymerase sigma-54 factor